MSTYIILVDWTDHGMRQVRDSPKRLDKAKSALREMGGQLKAFYMTMGGHDVVAIYDAPDDANLVSGKGECVQFGMVTWPSLEMPGIPGVAQRAYQIAVWIEQTDGRHLQRGNMLLAPCLPQQG